MGSEYFAAIAQTCFLPLPLCLLQDLHRLQSVFAAKPWRKGWLPLLRFMFSTRAAGVQDDNLPQRPKTPTVATS
jgi:hypothetical protein